MNIEVVKVTSEEKSILQNLIKMYCYEWSQYNKMDVNKNGEYDFEHHLSDFWEKEKHIPFFIKVNSNLAGFVLIDDDFIINKNADYSISEFFVMHKYRRAGVGRYAAKSIFDKHRGKWEIVQHPHNMTSIEFWSSVVNEYTGGQFTLIKSCSRMLYNDGSLGDIITFEN